MPQPALSIVVPAYNEERRIRPTLEGYVGHFRGQYPHGAFEVIVVLNGCRDNTRGVVEAVMAGAPEVRLLEWKEPLGKGGAILRGMAEAKGRLLAFVDADNMVRAAEAEKLLDALSTHDVAIGDRVLGTQLRGKQPFVRKLISSTSRAWVRLFLGLPYRDTQCGAKAFRAEAWRAIEDEVVETGWAFDLDVLAHARQHGLTVAEVPVEWEHIAMDSKVKVSDLPKTYLSTFGIRGRVRKAAKAGRPA